MTMILRSVLLLTGALFFTQCTGEQVDDASSDAGVGQASSTGSSSPNKVLTEADLPEPVVFDRSTRLEFEDDASNPIFNFSRGTIDIMFCPSSSEVLEGSDESGFHQSLICCADPGDEATRYGIFLLGDLDGIGFWDGTEFFRVEHEFTPDTWVHLAVVFAGDWTAFAVDGEPIGVLRARPGRPIDPQDPRGRSNSRICRTCVGGTISGEDGFQGRIAWVRTFRAPLSMYDVARLPGIVGVPEDPVLAQCLAMCSAWQGGSSNLEISSVSNRMTLAEAARAKKLEQPFVRGVSWVFDLASAQQLARDKGQRILAYSTRGDSYDQACLAVERGLLDDEWLPAMAQSYVPLLAVADVKNPSPMGVPAGECAFLDADGRVLRRFVPWSAEFIGGIDEQLKALAAETDADAMRARTILVKPSARISAAEMAELQALIKKPGTNEELVIRAEDALRVQSILDLQRRFQGRKAIAPAQGLPVEFDEARYLYEAEALRLFAELVLPLEPQPELADFAILLWGGLVEDLRLDLVEDVANFVVPMRALDVAVDATVGSVALNPELEDDSIRELEVGETGR